MKATLRMRRSATEHSVLRIARVTEILLETGDFSDLESLREQALKIYRQGEVRFEGPKLGPNPSLSEMNAALNELTKHITNVPRRQLTPDQQDAWYLLKSTVGEAYFAESPAGMIKIGYSENVLSRVRQVQYVAGDRARLLLALPGGRLKERYLHKRFAAHRAGGEWFDPAEEILAYIKEASPP